MALAKLDLLPRVFLLYPSITISETVYHEVVTAGLSIGAKDAEAQFEEYLEAIKNRRDIWISSNLCHKLMEALEAGSLD